MLQRVISRTSLARRLSRLLFLSGLLGAMGCEVPEPAPGPNLGVLEQAVEVTSVITGADRYEPNGWFTEQYGQRILPEVMTVRISGPRPIQTTIAVNFTTDFPDCGDRGVVQATYDELDLVWEAACTVANSNVSTTKRSFEYIVNVMGKPTSYLTPQVAIHTMESPRVVSTSIQFHGGSSPFGVGCDPATKVNCYYTDGDTMDVRWYPENDGNYFNNIDSVEMDFTPFGGQRVPAVKNAEGRYWAAIFFPAEGVANYNGALTMYATQDQSTRNVARSWYVDKKSISIKKNAQGRPVYITFSGATGTGGKFKSGDTVIVTWNDSPTGDNNQDWYQLLSVNFSTIGGAAAQNYVETPAGSDLWVAQFKPVASLDQAFDIKTTIRDKGNHGVTDFLIGPVTVDTILPTITTAKLSLSGGTGPGGVFNASDTVTVTWLGTSNGDGNSDLAGALGIPGDLGGANFQLAKIPAAPGDYYRGGFKPTVQIDTVQSSFQVQATDDAGNTAVASTPAFVLDTIVPSGVAGSIALVNPPATYKVGDTVMVRWTNDLGVNPDVVSAQIDFSALGRGVVAATKLAGTETWEASTTIPEGGVQGNSFTVAALPKDDANNEGRIVSNPIPVDAVTPIIRAGEITVQNATKPNERFLPNHTIEVIWTPNDGGEDVTAVLVTCTDLGIQQQPATKQADGTWKLRFKLVAGTFDGITTGLQVLVTDAAGNSATGFFSWNVTSFLVGAGPAWTTNPPVYSCQEACALLQGGDAAQYSCSTTPAARNQRAFLSGYGSQLYCAGEGAAENYKKPEAGGGYNCGSSGCSYSAYVQDHCSTSRNYCWTSTGLGIDADLRRPNVTPGAIQISGATGDNGYFRIGDTMRVAWDAVADGNTDITRVRVGFSSLGGPTLDATVDPTGIWSATWVVTAGTKDSAASTVLLYAYDDATNSFTQSSLGFKFDNQPPYVNPQAPLTLVGNHGAPVKVGDSVTATWTLGTLSGTTLTPFPGNGDIVRMRGDFSQYGGGVLEAPPVPNSPTLALTFTPVPTGTNDSPQATVPLVMRDDAGNELTVSPPALSVDNQPPTVTAAEITLDGDTDGNGVYQVGENLTVTWDNGLTGDHNLDLAPLASKPVQVDFTQLGGAAGVAATEVNGRWSASLAIVEGAVDVTGKAATVSVTDDAGYTVTASSPLATVNRTVPKISAAGLSLTNTTRPNQGFKVGDVARISWNAATDGNPQPYDFAEVAGDFAGFGGQVRAMTRNGDTWAASYSVTPGNLDGQAAVPVRVTDVGGNWRQASSANVAVDNEPPAVLTAAITVTGQNAQGNFAPGLTATVTWTPPAVAPNKDITSVTFNVTDFGCAQPVVDNQAPWSASCLIPPTVPENQQAKATVTASDELGNTGTGQSSPVAIITNGPKVNTQWITVENTGAGRLGKPFRVGDVMKVTWNNTAAPNGNGNGEMQSVKVDFAAFGGGLVNATEAANEVWSASYTLVAGQIDSAIATARVVATDLNNLQGAGLSAVQTVDTKLPVVTAAATSLAGHTGLNSTFKINDTLTLTWDDANGDKNGDIAVATFDFTAFGGQKVNAAELTNDVFTSSLKLPAGNLDQAAVTIPITVQDDVGNTVNGVSAAFRLDNIPPIVTAPRVSVTGATGTPNGSVFIIGDQVKVVWNNSAAGDNNQDALASAVADFSTLGGGAAVNLGDGGQAGCDQQGNDRLYSACQLLAEQPLERTDGRVVLTVTDNAGNVTAVTVGGNLAVDLQKPIVAPLALPDPAGKEGTAVNFSAAVQLCPAATCKYLWTFGDNTSSNLLGPSHTYGDNGAYPVVFRATDGAGNWAEQVASARITNELPVLTLPPDQNLNEGGGLQNFTLATLTDPGLTDTHTATVDWGEGGEPVELPIDPALKKVVGSHVYGADGIYTVTITVVDDDGGSAVGRLKVTVANVAPTLSNLTGNGVAAPASPTIDEGGTVLFKATATDPGQDDTTLTWRWDFGDGTFEEGPNKTEVSHKYAINSQAQPNGRYTMTLTVTDSDQARATATLPVTVRNLPPVITPLAAFQGQEGSPLQLTASAVDPGDPNPTYTWDLDLDLDADGDGNPSNDREASGKTVSVTYPDSKATPYRLAVTVTDASGLAARAEGQATIANLPPTVSLQALPPVPEGTVVNGVCTQTNLDLVAALGDPSSGDRNAGFKVEWDFGDGTPVRTDEGVKERAVVSHVYGDTVLANGKQSPYQVQVTVTDRDQGQQTATQQYIVTNVAPFALAGVQVGANIITGTYSVAEAQEITLTGSLSCDPGVVDQANLVYTWNFGDGSPVAAGREVNHAFRVAPDGTKRYTVILTVKDPHNATGSSTLVIDVDQSIPQPELLVDLSQEPREGEPVTFMGLVTNPLPGETYTYVWKWGDGSPDEEGDHVEHAFPDNGTFDVILGARNSRGTIGYADPVTVTVGNAAPGVTIVREQQTELGEGDRVALLAQVADPGVLDTHRFAWECNGAPVADVDGPRVECQPTQDGTYRVQVVVTDKDGDTGDGQLELEVINRPPVAVAPANQRDVAEGTALVLVADGRDPGTNDQLTYQWILPDESTVDGPELQYMVRDEGEQTVTLIATDDGVPPLASPPAVTTIFAVNLPPEVVLCSGEFDPTDQTPREPPAECVREGIEVEEGTPAHFTVLALDPGLDDVLSYRWNLSGREGDWIGTEEPSLTFAFPDEGRYRVRVRVEDEDGGGTEAELEVLVLNAPPVIESTEPVQGSEGSALRLIARVSDAGEDRLTYHWRFGDGQEEVTEEPEVLHTYVDSGEFIAELVVTDNAGAEAGTTIPVQVDNVPPSADAGEGQGAREGEQVTFTGTGTDISPADAANLTFEWDFGDGATAEGRVVTHVYGDEGPGRFTVTLTVTDPDGGAKQDTTWVMLTNASPVLAELADVETEEGAEVTLIAVATDPGVDDVLTYLWDFGDDSDVLEGPAEVTHRYEDRERPYQVTVRVEDGDGGWDEERFQVRVVNVPPAFVEGDEPSHSATQGVEYRHLLEGVDPGAEPLTFSLSRGPEGMSVTRQDDRTALLTWTPTVEQIGQTFFIWVALSDGAPGQQAVMKSWDVTVEEFLDADGDGLPDAFEQARGCTDWEVADAEQDPDGDGLTSLQEFARDASGTLSDPCTSNAPTAPSVHQPERGGAVASLQPELVVNNATDPDQGADYDQFPDLPLFYQFEVGLALGEDGAVVFATNRPADGPDGVAELCPLLTVEAEDHTSWSVPAGVLEENQRYQWRARACDGHAFGPWFEVADFFVNATDEPPSAPTPEEPVEGSAVTTASPVLVVLNALEPDGDTLTYLFEIVTDPDSVEVLHQSLPVAEGPDGRTRYDLAEAEVVLAEDVQSCFRAQAIDAQGHAGPFSELRCFFVNQDNRAPSTPTLLEPPVVVATLPERWYAVEHAAVVTTLEPELVFMGGADEDQPTPLAHLVEVDTSRNFDSALRQSSPDPQAAPAEALQVAAGMQGRWTPTTPLVENTLYFWRVRAWDGQSYGPPALGWFFVNTANDAPGVPEAISPEDGATVDEEQPELTIRNPADLDPDRERVTYLFQLATDDQFATVVAQGELLAADLERLSWRTEERLVGQTFYWHVRAQDQVLASDWSPTRSFRRSVSPSCTALAAPARLAPADRALLPLTTPPVLEVANVADCLEDPKGYEFELYTAADSQLVERSGAPVAEGAGNRTTYQVSTVLVAGAGYTWRARVVLLGGVLTSPWSDSGSFTVTAEPVCAALATPTPVAPTAGSTIPLGTVPVLEVQNVTDCADQTRVYEFELYRGTELGTATLVEQTQTPMIEGDGTTRYTVATWLHDPAQATPYLWRARVRLSGGIELASAWSEPTVFTVAPGWSDEVDEKEVHSDGWCALSDAHRSLASGLPVLLLVLPLLVLLRRRG